MPTSPPRPTPWHGSVKAPKAAYGISIHLRSRNSRSFFATLPRGVPERAFPFSTIKVPGRTSWENDGWATGVFRGVPAREFNNTCAEEVMFPLCGTVSGPATDVGIWSFRNRR